MHAMLDSTVQDLAKADRDLSSLITGLAEFYAFQSHNDAEYNLATLRELIEIRDLIRSAAKHADPERLDKIEDEWDPEMLGTFLSRRRQEVDA